MLVTPGDAWSGVCVLSAGRKKGSSAGDNSRAGWGRGGGGGRGAGAADGGGAGLAGVLKNCVKLPSGDAESEAPGEENPLAREGPGKDAEAGEGTDEVR